MKIASKIYLLAKTNLVKKKFLKQIIAFFLCFLSFNLVLLTHPANAKTSLSHWQRITLNKKMIQMETRLEQEYEQYFGKEIPDKKKSATQIAAELAILDQRTQTKSAVVWVMPELKYLHLVSLTSQGDLFVKDLYTVPANKLYQTVDDFYLEINQLNSPMDLTQAQQLYRWIIEPLEESVLEPEKIDNILFCLGKGIRTLPLAALHDGEKFAIAKYNLSRIPAFNLITTGYQSLDTPTVLAMGASDFTDNDPLPGVSLELQNIVDRLETQSMEADEQVLFNQDFTLPNMAKQLEKKSFDIVHLATHADFNPGSPDNSYIQFWDQKFTLEQMSNFPWQNPPDLLVLSACNTAIGDNDAQLGFTGVALQTGVKSALGSLWYVSDFGTLALITEFYEQLINHPEANPTKTQALGKAQNLLLQKKVYFRDNSLITPDGKIDLPEDLGIEGEFDLSHPFYWAAFTLISSPW